MTKSGEERDMQTRSVRRAGTRAVLAALLTTAAALVAGCSGTGAGTQRPQELGVVEAPAPQSGRHVYFAFEDPKDDDKGPGRYQYPLKFNNREGYLDITGFTVEDGGNNVVFTVTVRRPIPLRRDEDGSTEPKGWWLQLMDIYVDKDHRSGSGYTRALPGRHVEFESSSAWENVVLVTPNLSRTVEKMLEERTSDMDLVHMRKKILVPHRAYAQGYTFVVYVPKFEIGTPQPGWGYQVLMMGYDETNLSFGQFQNQEVVKFAGQEHFGGGSDFRGDPNVIDMLAPSAAEQYRVLGTYVAAPYAGDDRWATISCVYGRGGAVGSTTSAVPVAPGVTVEGPAMDYLAGQGGLSGVAAPVPGPVPAPKPVVPTPDVVPHESTRIESFEGGF